MGRVSTFALPISAGAATRHIGFPFLYVAYDREQFAGRDELEHELKRDGVLK